MTGGLAVNYKGQRGFEDDYDYVMYGRVYRFDPGKEDVVCVLKIHRQTFPTSLTLSHPPPSQDCVRIVRRITHVGSFRHMTNIVLGDPVFLLMRK